MIYLYCAVLKIRWQIWGPGQRLEGNSMLYWDATQLPHMLFQIPTHSLKSIEQETFWELRQIVSLTGGRGEKKRNEEEHVDTGSWRWEPQLAPQTTDYFSMRRNIKVFSSHFPIKKEAQPKSIRISWPALKTSVGHKYRADNGIRKEGHRKSLRAKFQLSIDFITSIILIHFFWK